MSHEQQQLRLFELFPVSSFEILEFDSSTTEDDDAAARREGEVRGSQRMNHGMNEKKEETMEGREE